MPIPLPPETAIVEDERWASLDPAAKRERLLAAAAEVFRGEGLEASMPAVAAAAGAGVASVYRQFPSKHELLAALVVQKLERLGAEVDEARAQPGGRFEALVAMLWRVVERQGLDDFLGGVRRQFDGHPDVRIASARTYASLDRLIAECRAEGRLRADASSADIRLLLAATRAARRIDPAAWRRTLQLFLDALERPSAPARRG